MGNFVKALIGILFLSKIPESIRELLDEVGGVVKGADLRIEVFGGGFDDNRAHESGEGEVDVGMGGEAGDEAGKAIAGAAFS